MTGNEKDLLAMKEAGMIGQAEFDVMWKELHSEEDASHYGPVTEAMSLGETQSLQPIQCVKISGGAYSEKGIREQNEDSFLLGNESGGAKDMDQAALFDEGDGPFFFAVADGMGGHDAGEIASAFVVMKLRQSASFQTVPADEVAIEVALKGIHAELLTEARKRGTPKMGSTIAGIVLQKGNSGFFNVGDSRVYRLRHGYLQQISEDDSLARLVPGAAKNVITNAVGAGKENMSVASRFSPSFAAAGDVFLLCSDGVHGVVGNDDLALILGLSDSPQDIARIIVERAIKNNSDDNCTAVVVKLLE
jgi:protein phosphatase